MTPLEFARAKTKTPVMICCIKCSQMVVIDKLAYCEHSGKIIMPMHLETRRENQCKETFKARKGEIRIEAKNNISSDL